MDQNITLIIKVVMNAMFYGIENIVQFLEGSINLLSPLTDLWRHGGD